MKRNFKWFNLIFALVMALSLMGMQGQASVSAQTEGPDLAALQAACLDGGRGIMARADSQTGFTQFIGTRANEPIQLSEAMKAGSPEDVARAYLEGCGGLLGLRDSRSELSLMHAKASNDGQRTTVRFQQQYNGIPVVAGEIFVQFNSSMDILAIGGEILPEIRLDTNPAFDFAAAQANAIASVAKQYNMKASSLRASDPVLKIYSPALLEGWNGPTSLVWEMQVTQPNALHLDQYVLVNAQRGNVLVSFNQVDFGLDLATYDNNNTGTLPPLAGSLVCTEADPTCAASTDADAKGAHIGAKNTYDFYFNQHGRDSIDNAGMQLKSVVDYFSASVCPNAFWSSSLGMMVYCDTFAQADDVVAHELTHGITSRESRLFYYYQSGAINESFSDVWGEFIDQTSTTGIDDDSVGVKWLMGEDIGALRDMADPTTFSDPDKISSANYYEGDFDNGGVHTNSGVNNKAAYLMTDGGTFNTITVNALGIPKVAAVYYEVQTNLLTSGSDYRDLHDALYQACNNLIGTTPPGAGSAISVTDCDDGVFAAVEAVEMDTEPAVNFNPEAPVCDTGSALDLLYDSVENGVYNMDPNGVKVLTGVTNYAHWYPTNFNATSGLKSYYGDDFDYDGGSARSDTYMVMRGGVYLPAALPNAYLRFNHAYGFENTGVNYYDGGVLEYSINNGANWADANSLIDSGAYDYNGTISNSFDNPLKGRAAFVGDSHGFISSRLNLTPLLGKSVLFRWRMGTDFIGYDWGWWVDDIEFYSCYAVTPTVQMGFFRSQAANDGMILESAETTNAGGTLDSTKMYIGDDALDRQYKGLVSFDTSTLPDNAVIISATLRLKQSVPFIGQNVFNTHGYLVADVRRNMFGTSPSLQTMDFNVSPNLAVSGQFNPTASGGRWRSAYLSSSAPFISLGGVTQFRVYFTRDDNDDISADYIRFFTGEAGSKAPQLFVYYFIP